MCSDLFRDRLSVWQRDSDGRVLSLLICFVDINVNLVNLYVPTIPAERRAFLRLAHAYFFPNSRLVLAGDFNCYDSSLHKWEVTFLSIRVYPISNHLAVLETHGVSSILESVV